MKTLEALKWRYSTKKFDSSKKIEEEKLDKLKEAIQLTASSYGLQAFKVFTIQDTSIKEKLLPASFNQQQVVDADTIFVLANYTSVTNEDIDQYVKLIANTRDINVNEVKSYGNFMKETISKLDKETQNLWLNRQTYIALGSLLIAAGELEIDACPMEGFNAKKYNEILGLDKMNLNASLVIPVGYRAQNDNTQYLKKVRKPIEELFTTI